MHVPPLPTVLTVPTVAAFAHPLVLLLTCFVVGACSHAATDANSTVCSKNIVLMGYWPPTNEMLRPFSTHPERNLEGWRGRNWHNSGFDVYAFFPEFPPDGDPSNDQIGDPGSVGAQDADLRVDYQDTSADFWRIVTTYKPIALITTSRGGAIEWELEAIEGGHGTGTGDPSRDWRSDANGIELPTRDSVDVRSWQAMANWRNGHTLNSTLPLEAIEAAVNAQGVLQAAIDTTGTSGDYLSGFLGLHGLFFNSTSAYNQMAGHIHVGRHVATDDASRALEASLETVIARIESCGT